MSGSGRFRPLAVLLGGLVVFVGMFQIAEWLVGPPEESRAAGPSAASDESGAPLAIEVERLGTDGFKIKVGGIDVSTVRIMGAEDGSVDALVACVNEGIEQARSEGSLHSRGSATWLARQAERHRLSEQVSRIQQRCLTDRSDGMLLPELPPHSMLVEYQAIMLS